MKRSCFSGRKTEQIEQTKEIHFLSSIQSIFYKEILMAQKYETL